MSTEITPAQEPMPTPKPPKTVTARKMRARALVETEKPMTAGSRAALPVKTGRRAKTAGRTAFLWGERLEATSDPTTSGQAKVHRAGTITVTDITTAVAELASKPFDAATFPFDILTIYRDTPKTTLANLKNGTKNPAHKTGGVLLKKVLYFQPCGLNEDPGVVADRLLSEKMTEKNAPRFIIVTNGEIIHIRDLKTNEPPCNRAWDEDEFWGHFLLPLNPKFDRAATHEEHPADVKAATTLRRLYEAILKASPTWADGNHTHELNVFMTRVLFCLYAEDTGIFDTKNLFTDTVEQYSNIDGRDLAALLDRLFRIMNVEQKQRPRKLSPIEAAFPYVNGNLFEATLPIPTFDRLARRSLLECGILDWAEINPDIFGSMIQTIADAGSRSAVGMHYTSSTNIMKVLQPLFLDDLKEAFEKAKASVGALESLRDRLSKIRVFDPACGSGNFLILAYKELRRLEMRVLSRLAEISPNQPLEMSNISIANFFGMDVIDFACETARLSLWIAEHQMNGEFLREFGRTKPSLPLVNIKTIVRANALATDWSTICPPDAACETYICGNPPYIGSSNQNADQKKDIDRLFSGRTDTYKNIDYIGGFFLKASEYIRNNDARAGLVSTNSICQGEQVAILWPLIYADGVGISFAHTSFKWSNNAAHNAGVSCVIVGLARQSAIRTAKLFQENIVQPVKEIGPYLVPGSTVIVARSTGRPAGIPEMVWGNKPTDGGHLILTPEEYREMISRYPQSASFLRRYYGSDEIINSIERWCLWISDDRFVEAASIPPIRARIAAVREMRLESKAKSTVEYAQWPYKFRQIQDFGKPAIAVPSVASERRRYIAAVVLGPDAIINNLAYAVYNPPPFLFALISSRLHRLWAGAVGGSLETRIRYSSTLVYNTFPIPALSNEQKRTLASNARAILQSREKYPGLTLADLYNPETMPPDVFQVHEDNDVFIEEHLFGRRFNSDGARLDALFAMYSMLKSDEQENSLFAKESIVSA